MDVLKGLALLTQSIGFGANVFSIFMSPMALALYLFGFTIFTINRIIIAPIVGRAQSDMVRSVMSKDKKNNKQGSDN